MSKGSEGEFVGRCCVEIDGFMLDGGGVGDAGFVLVVGLCLEQRMVDVRDSIEVAITVTIPVSRLSR